MNEQSAPPTVLSGLTLHVADVERSLEYYRRIPGADVVQHRPGQFALLRFGGGRLGLLSASVLPPGSARFHIEISTTASDVDTLYAQVQAAGIEPGERPQNRGWGERTFHATDPDGNLIEFDSRLDERSERQ